MSTKKNINKSNYYSYSACGRPCQNQLLIKCDIKSNFVDISECPLYFQKRVLLTSEMTKKYDHVLLIKSNGYTHFKDSFIKVLEMLRILKIAENSFFITHHPCLFFLTLFWLCNFNFNFLFFLTITSKVKVNNKKWQIYSFPFSVLTFFNKNAN